MTETNNRFSWLSEKVEVRKHDLLGRGVFARESIRKDEVICVMGGYILNTDQENSLGEFATEYNMDISEEWSFCPRSEADLDAMPQHLINHSCEPNVGFSEQCFISAIRDVEKDEEIVYDYAFVMYSHEDSALHFSMACKCTSLSCRKSITEHDWKIKSIQEKYGDYFQPFLKKKFKM